MLIGAPDWEGGDPSMMSSESTVDREAEDLMSSSIMNDEEYDEDLMLVTEGTVR